MPFGLIFGALFFLLSAWTGVQLLSAPGPLAKVAGLMLLVLGILLAVGLLSRQTWARWMGAVSALGMAVFGLWRVNTDGAALDFVMLIAGLAAAVLLVIPATSTDGKVRASAPSRLLPAVSAVTAAGLLGVAVWALLGPSDATAHGQQGGAGPVARQGAALPATASARVRWVDFGGGMDRARAENKPLLVNFNATWCGYCKKMDRETWSHPSVVSRMDDVVAVRVDIDDERRRNGYSGSELAGTYRVNGTPTQMLIDPSGRVISRAGGYQAPRQLLSWLESALGAQGGGNRSDSGPSSGP